MLSRVLLHVVVAALRRQSGRGRGFPFACGPVVWATLAECAESLPSSRSATSATRSFVRVIPSRRNPSRIKQLAAARGIKSGSIENQGGTRIGV